MPRKNKKLKRDYRKMKDHNGKTGRERKKWPFYDKMDGILGDRPANTPPVVVDTSAEVLCAIQENNITENGEERSEVSDPDPELEEDDEDENIVALGLPNNLFENVHPNKKGKKDSAYGTNKCTRPTRSEAIEKSMNGAVLKWQSCRRKVICGT